MENVKVAGFIFLSVHVSLPFINGDNSTHGEGTEVGYGKVTDQPLLDGVLLGVHCICVSMSVPPLIANVPVDGFVCGCVGVQVKVII